jgi:hypothetical protein
MFFCQYPELMACLHLVVLTSPLCPLSSSNIVETL